MNVLIVDDSKAMQNIVTRAMKSVGYVNDHYSYAADGEQALQIILRDRPDLVLCDMHMPKMTGLEMLTALRTAKNLTKVVIVSIDDDKKTVQNITAAGGDAYLKKPFTSEQLFTTITGLIGDAVPTKLTDSSKVNELIPSVPVIERILGSLAGSDVQLTAAHFKDIDFDCSPYYGASLQDDQGRLVLGVFLDAMATNTVAAIISRRPLLEAVEAARSKQLDTTTKQSALAFLGLMTGLCKPSDSGQLLDVETEHHIENTLNLSKRLNQYAELLVAYSINCGPCRDGKIIFISP